MRRILILATLALAACSPEFDPASKIEKLRVVGLRAEPPELDPAGVQTAALESLVLRADYLTTTRTSTVVHLVCVPVPGSEDPTPCVMLSNLTDPAVQIAAAARYACAQGAAADPAGSGATWPAIALAGIEACVDGVCGAAGAGAPPAQLALPTGFTFSPAQPPAVVTAEQIAAWQQRVAVARILGVQAVDLAFTVDATPDELVAGAGTACPSADLADRLAALWATREHVLSVKRVPIRGPESPNLPNRNPAVDGIQATGATLDPVTPTTVAAGDLLLTPVLPAGAAGVPEVYATLDADGRVIEVEAEQWVYSWFSTAGELKDLHTRSTTKADKWTVFDRGPARVVVVVRDLRGGTAWQVRDVVVE